MGLRSKTPLSNDILLDNPFNFFISVSERNLEAKINGMECYEFEKRPYPHPRSPEALRIQAARWGVAVGQKYSEAFMLVRTIN